ncbi:MAG: nucleotidyl transferase AbiEii/AbiGii toxin family protein [Caulobacteraceae bacterium]
MTKAPIGKDVAASVRQRLLNHARDTQQDFQRVLVRYGIERLLYRLSQSPQRERFVLKGAMLFAAWSASPFRSTGDLDLLAFGPDDIAAATETFANLCAQGEAEDRVGVDSSAGLAHDDGLVFLGDSVTVERTREDEDYRGLHVRLEARLKNTRIPILIDIGFGDPVHPAPVELDYPRLLLEMPAAHIRTYPPESVIAEKFDAMIRFDAQTSRLKDYYDIWAISETFPFRSTTLIEAARRTHAQRGRETPATWPASLLPEFAERADKATQWKSFLQRTSPMLEPPAFPEVLARVRVFLAPVLQGLQDSGEQPDRIWTAGHGWR